LTWAVGDFGDHDLGFNTVREVLFAAGFGQIDLLLSLCEACLLFVGSAVMAFRTTHAFSVEI
jgi:hypothetical protein